MTNEEAKKHAAASSSPFVLEAGDPGNHPHRYALEFVNETGHRCSIHVPDGMIPQNARLGDLLYLTTEPPE